MAKKLLLTSNKVIVRKRRMDRRLLHANCSMYAMAHDYVYGSKIEQGVIMVCTPDLYYQEFKTEGASLKAWKHKALKRINMYNELMHDEKENIMKKQSDLPGLKEMIVKEKNER